MLNAGFGRGVASFSIFIFTQLFECFIKCSEEKHLFCLCRSGKLLKQCAGLEKVPCLPGCSWVLLRRRAQFWDPLAVDSCQLCAWQCLTSCLRFVFVLSLWVRSACWVQVHGGMSTGLLCVAFE